MRLIVSGVKVFLLAKIDNTLKAWLSGCIYIESEGDNMKKVITGSLLFLVLSLVFFLSSLAVSCAPGLEPAWTTGNSSTLCVSLGGTCDGAPLSTGSPPATGARAIMSGNGFLYIQTGITADTAKVYGPYPAASGSSVTITDIPPGKYPEMAIFFLSSEASGYMLPVIPDVQTAEGFVAQTGSNFSNATDLRSSSSVAFVKDCTIVAGARNAVQAVLIPTTNLFLNSNYFEIFGNASGVSRRFSRIEGILGKFPAFNPGPESKYTIHLSSSNPLTLHSVGLYTSDGKKVVLAKPDVYIDESTVAYTLSVPWTGNDFYYLYTEFSGTVLSFSDSAE